MLKKDECEIKYSSKDCIGMRGRTGTAIENNGRG